MTSKYSNVSTNEIMINFNSFLFLKKATSDTAVGTVMLISAGITTLPLFLSIYMHFHLKGKRIADFPNDDENEDEDEESGNDETKTGEEKIAEDAISSGKDSSKLQAQSENGVYSGPLAITREESSVDNNTNNLEPGAV